MQVALNARFALVLIFFSMPALSFAETNACYYPSQNICVEDGGMLLGADCERDGGQSMEQCPEEYRIGTCEIMRQGKMVNVRYYEGTQINPRQSCSGLGGSYTPGFLPDEA